MIISVGSALAVVIYQSDNANTPEPNQSSQEFKLITVDSNYNTAEVNDYSNEDEFYHLRNIIRKLREDVKAIPAVTAPLY